MVFSSGSSGNGVPRSDVTAGNTELCSLSEENQSVWI